MREPALEGRAGGCKGGEENGCTLRLMEGGDRV